MIVLVLLLCALLFANMALIVQRQYHSYVMRTRHIDSLYAVRDALRNGQENARATIDAELKKA